MKAPFIGEIVHFVDDTMDDTCYCTAAIIVAIRSYPEHAVDLVCFSVDDKVKPHTKMPHSTEMTWGDWHHIEECPLHQANQGESA
jgi:hypothetical protein